MDPSAHIFFAPCPRGLEAVLSAELESLCARDIAATHGGVGFAGPFELCYRVNLESRVASRVLWRVGSGAYRREQDLYEAASDLPWPDWFSARRTIKVKVSARYCPLKSLDFVTLRIKDAVCDRFMAVTGRRPDVDTRRPDIRIDAYLDHQNVTFYLDTSGEPLFKRGLRHASVEAPLRENLAAGILMLSGWKADTTLLDPMCGGGTILMEAAQMGKNIAPGLGRRFAFERLHGFDSSPWQSLCEVSRSRHTPDVPLSIYGCDRLERAMRDGAGQSPSGRIGPGREIEASGRLGHEAAERGGDSHHEPSVRGPHGAGTRLSGILSAIGRRAETPFSRLASLFLDR